MPRMSWRALAICLVLHGCGADSVPALQAGRPAPDRAAEAGPGSDPSAGTAMAKLKRSDDLSLGLGGSPAQHGSGVDADGSLHKASLRAPTAVESLTVAAPGDENAIRVLLVPARETILVSQMVGRIERMPTRLGETFARGQTMISFDCGEALARRQMAEAELNAAAEQHEAKLRLQGLQSAGEVEVALAASAREKARAQVDLTRAQLEPCRIAAPFAGRVVKLHARPHQGVNIGVPLVEFVSTEAPRLKVNVPSRWLGWMKPGTRFAVTVDETGSRHMAEVSSINGRVDAVSQTVEIEAVVRERASALLPGMSGSAVFDIPQKRVGAPTAG